MRYFSVQQMARTRIKSHLYIEVWHLSQAMFCVAENTSFEKQLLLSYWVLQKANVEGHQASCIREI